MAKLNQMQKCVVTNRILSMLNNDTMQGGETITIVIETKKNGDLKNIEIKKGDNGDEI